MVIKLQGTNSTAAPGLTNDGADGVVVGTDSVDISIAGTSKVKVNSSGNVDINGSPPWSVSGGDYRNISISGEVANSGGFLWLGNGTATTNGGHDLARVNVCNGATIVSQIAGTTDTSANDDGRLSFHTKATGGSLTEKLRVESGGNVKIVDGDLVIGTSGHGIDFSATSDATGKTSELLDDYEEGTWTPVLKSYNGSSWGNLPFSSNPDSTAATYTRIGRYVHFSFRFINFSANASGSGFVKIGGLPFTATHYGASSFGFVNCMTDTDSGNGLVNGTEIEVYRGDNWNTWKNSTINAHLYMTGTYET